MNIICDVDNCILKYSESFLNYYNLKYNKNIRYNDLESYFFTDYGITQSQIYEYFDYMNILVHYIYTENLLRVLYEDFKDNIVLITSAPNTSKVRNQRENNLRIKNIPYHHIIYDDNKYKYLEELQPIRLIIEDNPQQIDNYLLQSHLFNHIVIPLHPWTKKYLDINNPKIKIVF